MPNARIQEADEVLTFARTELEKYYRMVTGDDLADDAAILTVDNALDARLDEYAVEACLLYTSHECDVSVVCSGFCRCRVCHYGPAFQACFGTCVISGGKGEMSRVEKSDQFGSERRFIRDPV